MRGEPEQIQRLVERHREFPNGTRSPRAPAPRPEQRTDVEDPEVGE